MRLELRMGVYSSEPGQLLICCGSSGRWWAYFGRGLGATNLRKLAHAACICSLRNDCRSRSLCAYSLGPIQIVRMMGFACAAGLL
jgi:hypothetical protein